MPTLLCSHVRAFLQLSWYRRCTDHLQEFVIGQWIWRTPWWCIHLHTLIKRSLLSDTSCEFGKINEIVFPTVNFNLPLGLPDLDRGGVPLYGSTREFSREPRASASSPRSYLHNLAKYNYINNIRNDILLINSNWKLPFESLVPHLILSINGITKYNLCLINRILILKISSLITFCPGNRLRSSVILSVNR